MVLGGVVLGAALYAERLALCPYTKSEVEQRLVRVGLNRWVTVHACVARHDRSSEVSSMCIELAHHVLQMVDYTVVVGNAEVAVQEGGLKHAAQELRRIVRIALLVLE